MHSQISPAGTHVCSDAWSINVKDVLVGTKFLLYAINDTS
jgi:hypothetical protein